MLNKKKLYIEITQSNIFIAKLIESKKSFFLFNIKNIKLLNLEIQDHSIFNLSALLIEIKKYLKQYNIKKGQTIICLPNIKGRNYLHQHLYLLQIILLISKTNINIKKIILSNILRKGINMPYKFFITKKDLTQQLNFFRQFHPPTKYSIKKWLSFTGILLIGYIFLYIAIQKHKTIELQNIAQKNIQLSKSLESINTKIKKLKRLRTINTQLEYKINKLKKLKEKTNNPLNLLTHISQNIPKKCKLTKINIYSEKNKGKPKEKYISLEGIASSYDKINIFYKRFSKSTQIEKTQIKKIKKIKTPNKEDRYIYKMLSNIVKV